MIPANPACELLGCAEPVVLAGMGGPARAELVAAVTAAGGFGFLGMVREPPALIRREVEELRRRGCDRFGVNIIPAATAPELLKAQLDTIIALEVPVVALFWDLDLAVMERLAQAGIDVVYQVGSAAEAAAVEAAGARLIVAQGREAGGHVRGRTPLRELLPQVVARVRVPVLAAGGLATGGDLLVARALGAAGMVLGTAFLAASESFAHPYHKLRLLAGHASDTLLTDMFHVNWPAGAPVRVLANAVTVGGRGAENPERPVVIGADDGRPIYLFSTDSPLCSTTGDLECMALYAGTAVGRLTRIRPAAEIMREIVAEAAWPALAPPQSPQASSPVCYIGETGGAYQGEPEPAELADEIGALVAELRALLQAELGRWQPARFDGPSFHERAVPLARQIVRLASLSAPAAGEGERQAEPRAAALARLGRLIPRLPEDDVRETLSALRALLAEVPRRAGEREAAAVG